MNGYQETRMTKVPIANLHFDYENPRLPTNIKNRKAENDILLWLLEDAGILDLMMSIAEQGYFSGEPLLVVETSPDYYVVIEGNRRLAALKLLNNPAIAPIRQKSIQNIIDTASSPIPIEVPVITYNNRDQILSYLGFRHVTGIKQWSPLAKARYLYDLSKHPDFEGDKDKYAKLAKTIGSRIDYVKRLLAGLMLYEEIENENFYGIKNLDEESLAFSLVTTALANNNIVAFLGLANAQDMEQQDLNRPHLRELTHWIFNKADGKTRLGESRNFRYLDDVVGDERALEQFRAGVSLLDAVTFTRGPLNTFRAFIEDAETRLRTAQSQLHLVAEFEEADFDRLTYLSRIARDMISIIRQRLNEKDLG